MITLTYLRESDNSILTRQFRSEANAIWFLKATNSVPIEAEGAEEPWQDGYYSPSNVSIASADYGYGGKAGLPTCKINNI